MNTTDKFYWVMDHPAIGNSLGQAEIEITPHMVNPETREIDDDSSKNIKMALWVEVSKTDHYGDSVHYWQLDAGGFGFDEAVDKLYNLTLEHYGEYDTDGLYFLYDETSKKFLTVSDGMPVTKVEFYLLGSVFTSNISAEQTVFKNKLKNVTVMPYEQALKISEGVDVED